MVDREVTIASYEPDAADLSQLVQSGNAVEVRGIVLGDGEIQFGDLNRFEGEFDTGTYEQMIDYYHGMCNHLCVKKEVA